MSEHILPLTGFDAVKEFTEHLAHTHIKCKTSFEMQQSQVTTSLVTGFSHVRSEMNVNCLLSTDSRRKMEPA
jgi:hypothetical protein